MDVTLLVSGRTATEIRTDCVFAGSDRTKRLCSDDGAFVDILATLAVVAQEISVAASALVAAHDVNALVRAAAVLAGALVDVCNRV